MGASAPFYNRGEWSYSENARVCAKWQWNARDSGVIGLHDRRSRECNPVTPVECVSLSFRTHTHVRSRFYHIHNVYKRNWDGPCLMNLTQNSYSWLHIFQIGNLFHCVVDSWWNMPFKGTRHGNGVADGAVLSGCNYDSTHQHYEVTQFEYLLWRHTMHEWVMNIHYKTWSSPPRNNGACVLKSRG